MDAFMDIVNEHLGDKPITIVGITSMNNVAEGRRELQRAGDIWGGTPLGGQDLESSTRFTVTVPNAVAGALCACVSVKETLADGTRADVTDTQVSFVWA